MTLFIVATPIGNLEDITLRALETLKKVAKIYCEDTRRTKVLLNRYEIKTPLDSFHQHTPGKITGIVNELLAGTEIAYVTDAGTPGIQDPGGQLVAAARSAGVRVVPIPGVSAVTALLSVAGLPADSFWFVGYLPTKKGRQTLLKKIIASDETVVLFETGPRFGRLLRELEGLGGSQKHLVVGRELTKKFEEVVVGSPAELADYFTTPPKGEFVIALATGI